MGRGNAAIKGQMVVENNVTGETMRVPLGAPRAKQWSTPDAATQYLRSLVGAEDANQLQDIRVNDVPIDQCPNLASMRQQGGVMNVTASIVPAEAAEPVAAAAAEPEMHDDVAPMETEIDGLALKMAQSPKAAKPAMADFENMTPFERMMAVPPSQWLY